MSHSPFPWIFDPRLTPAVFDADGKQIVWSAAPAAAIREALEAAADIANRFDDCSGSFIAERILDSAAEVIIPTPIDPETAADNAALIAAIPEMVSTLSGCMLHLEYANSGFISGSMPDLDWIEKREELVADARAVLQKVKQP